MPSRDRLDEAIEKYREGIKISKDDRATINNLAMLLIERGNKDDLNEAYELMQKLTEQHPDNAVIADTMGWVLYHQGNYKRAQKVFEQGIQIDSYLPDSHYHLGKVFLKLEKPELAAKEFEQALKLSTSFRGAEDARDLLIELKKEENGDTEKEVEK